MERLTIRNSDGSVSQPVDLKWDKALEKLAAYEDTGLAPEKVFALQTQPDHAYADCVKEMWKQIGGMNRMEELAKAEAEGRLLVLPCKVGTVVYIAGSKYRAGRWETWVNTGKFRLSDLEKLGKTVFLTREQAEAALQEETTA